MRFNEPSKHLQMSESHKLLLPPIKESPLVPSIKLQNSKKSKE
jgi:hypothetical protein